MDSCCFIDAVKHEVGILPPERDADVWHIKKLLEAHRAGDVTVYASMLCLAECVAVEAGQDDVPEEVKDHFRNLLTSGQYVTLAQPAPRTGRIARDLRWNEGLVLGGPDAIHVATALEVGADEFITSDGRLNSAKMAAVAKKLAEAGTLRIIRGQDTRALPATYRQGDMLDGQGKG